MTARCLLCHNELQQQPLVLVDGGAQLAFCSLSCVSRWTSYAAERVSQWAREPIQAEERGT